jgi:periplasmic copper chaperone A
MKIKSVALLLLITLSTGLIIGCGGESEPQSDSAEISGEGIHIEGAWARPASEGRMSAAYFLITNFENENDTLISVQSDVAQLVEIHESYELEEGMMGMREVPELEIPAQSTVRLQQGGLHIMLIQVTQTLADGDTFELTLNFARTGEQTVEIPVRL